MERKIGEVFKSKGMKVIVTEIQFGNGCDDCVWNNDPDFECIKIPNLGSCSAFSRKDGKSVIFKEVTK